ncbi:MAG TPA: hypothetical protein PKK78_07765 [Kouleothrix sp.]|jgi:hypothetical protein|nr:hypothetical protein [Kouleothrix sp.]
MNDIELSTAELPEAIRVWLTLQPAVVVAIERLSDERVLLRLLPEVAPELVARAQVTMAQYREALMNLT